MPETSRRARCERLCGRGSTILGPRRGKHRASPSRSSPISLTTRSAAPPAAVALAACSSGDKREASRRLDRLKSDPIASLTVPGGHLVSHGESRGRPYDVNTFHPAYIHREYAYSGDLRTEAQAVLRQAMRAGWSVTVTCSENPRAYLIAGHKDFGRWTGNLQISTNNPGDSRGQLLIFSLEAPYPGTEPSVRLPSQPSTVTCLD